MFWISITNLGGYPPFSVEERGGRNIFFFLSASNDIKYCVAAVDDVP